jgi:hypothetical protein
MSFDYHPQQSVLNPHSGQRQTACIRYISALPHRSQIIASSHSARGVGVGLAATLAEAFGKGTRSRTGISDMGVIIGQHYGRSKSMEKIQSVLLLIMVR